MASETRGIYALSRMQMGFETTPGTAVAATARWRGEAAHIDPQQVQEYINEHIGIFGGAGRKIKPKDLAQIALTQTNASFEQLPYLYAMLYGGAKTGVADGTGSTGFKYTTTIPTTTAPTMTGKTMTWETGDNARALEMQYTHALEVVLSGMAGEGLKVAATLQGRQATASTFTGSLAPLALEDILTSKGALYLDDVDGTIGTTQISQQVLGITLTKRALWVPKFTMDGEIYFQFIQYGGHEITGSITFEHDTGDIVGSGDEWSKWDSLTPRLLRVEFTGGAYGTAGTGTTFDGTKGLRIDLPITWDKFQPVSNMDGNSIIVADFTSKYDITAQTSGSIVIANELSALP